MGSRPSAWIAEHGPAYLAFVGPFRTAADGCKDTGPLVVKEAMAMAVPVITTRHMGMKETVDATSGFLADPGDRPGLLACLEQFLALTPAERIEAGPGCPRPGARPLHRCPAGRGPVAHGREPSEWPSPSRWDRPCSMPCRWR